MPVTIYDKLVTLAAGNNIGDMSALKAENQRIWFVKSTQLGSAIESALNAADTCAKFVQQVKNITGGEGIYHPFFLPGNTSNLTSLPDYTTIRGLVLGPEVSGTYSAAYIGYYDSSGNGFAAATTSSNTPVFRLNGTNYNVSSGLITSTNLGVGHYNLFDRCGLGVIFISSDNIVYWVMWRWGNSSKKVVKWTAANSTRIINWIQGLPDYVEPVPPDPYEQGGTTGDDDTDPEGGDGTFENEEVPIDPPALPSLSAITSGFIAVYNPTFAQLQSLGDYLWSDLFSLDTFKKLFSDPMQAILGLSIVPVQPGTADGTVVIGNVNTGISMPRCTGQFVTVDCGTVTLPEYWGGYLDYSPYTKVEIYLPYIGVRPLDTDEVMGKTLHVVYHVDILSGSCVCFIQCNNTIRYHYVGQCGASIPITANDWTRVVNGAVSIATALGVGVATLGAGAAAGGATAASMAGTGALVGGIASQVLASKPRVEHSGSLAGMGGLLGVQVPYIMVVRPRQAVPEGQNTFTGYPSFIRRTLSTVTGYTQVTGVHLVGLTCTDEEKREIQAQLESGVIL